MLLKCRLRSMCHRSTEGHCHPGSTHDSAPLVIHIFRPCVSTANHSAFLISLVCIFLVISAFCTSAIIKYSPHYLTRMTRRATYYLMGQEGDERLLWQWI